jgi:hypothetical protein
MADDPFAAATETYPIVVAGVMNPAIHHPAWYKAMGALSDKELQSTGAIVHSGSRRLGRLYLQQGRLFVRRNWHSSLLI